MEEGGLVEYQKLLINCTFILAALKNLGFYHDIIRRINVCIIGTSFSVLINGQPHTSFSPNSGTRQDCPLSPYLFVIAINELSKMLQVALSQNNLSIVTLGPCCPQIHSLIFIENLIIYG
ncbi:hypothetical protein U9M48_009182 [Paspalum notatum var. saurae]|uniref:Reverse transcriptase domain-containing protein n=1 Tax=Paspalum notatum var. saurae TaxID=547442 RepID=A0AAQ3SS64_PASNO